MGRRRVFTNDNSTLKQIMPWIMVAIATAFIVAIAFGGSVRAMDHGFDHSTAIGAWFETVPMPTDQTAPRSKCCGKGDAYEADIYDIEGYEHGRKMCKAVITDGSAKVWPDGTRREPLANGTEFEFECVHVNPPEDGNPTGHAQAFLNVGSWGDEKGKIKNVYCFVPLPPGS